MDLSERVEQQLSEVAQMKDDETKDEKEFQVFNYPFIIIIIIIIIIISIIIIIIVIIIIRRDMVLDQSHRFAPVYGRNLTQCSSTINKL